jgi:mono/diheme cytochrome c family protein
MDRLQGKALRLVVTSLIAGLGWLCACRGDPAPKREWTAADHGQPKQPSSDRVPQPSAPAEGENSGEPPIARAARALFIASCASCHGRDGRGQGEARPPGARMPDFTSQSFQNQRSDRQFALAIRDGRPMMPPFGKQVTEQGIAALVQYVRTFASAPAAAAPGDAGVARAEE